MKRNRDFGLSIGAPSIVVIMVILCLVCFAGLSIVNENQILSVNASFLETASGERTYTITRWQVVTTQTPELDQSLPVFTGN